MVKLAKASLSFLDRASKVSGKSRKSSKKTKKVEGKSKEADGVIKVPKDPMRATFKPTLRRPRKPQRMPSVR